MSDLQGSAEFSGDAQHRHRLDRWWSDAPRALVCGCNPSQAGAEVNDPTVWRLVELLRPIPSIGGFTIVNWEDRVATDPAAMRAWRMHALHTDEAGYNRARDANLARIRALSEVAPIRIVAWGDLVPMERQTTLVLRALSLDWAHPLHAFGTTASGAPLHPMARGRSRIPPGTLPTLWREHE